jgi:hypothetical protein
LYFDTGSTVASQYAVRAYSIAELAGAVIEPDETGLRAADAEEFRIILARDGHAEQVFMYRLDLQDIFFEDKPQT